MPFLCGFAMRFLVRDHNILPQKELHGSLQDSNIVLDPATGSMKGPPKLRDTTPSLTSTSLDLVMSIDEASDTPNSVAHALWAYRFFLHIRRHIYIYIYVCVCLFVMHHVYVRT